MGAARRTPRRVRLLLWPLCQKRSGVPLGVPTLATGLLTATKQAPEEAAAPLGLVIGLGKLVARPQIVVTGLCRAASGLTITRAGALPACHLALATWREAGKHDLSIFEASLRDQRIERCGILRRDAYATV